MANLNIKNKKEKESTIFTPDELSYYIYKIIREQYYPEIIFDPCIGVSGGMTKYFKKEGFKIIGADIDENSKEVCDIFYHKSIKDIKEYSKEFKPELVVMNPPFNGNGRKDLLFPHLFLKNIFEEFGYDMKVVMITGDNFLNNNRKKSKRLKWISDNNINITSIMTLPLDIFDGVLFNCQVLFFNMPKLKPYYIFDIDKI